MNATFKLIFLLCLVVWLGAGAFLSFAVLPTLFAQLDRPVAGSVASALFSIYDVVGLTAAVLLVVSTMMLAVRVGPAWKRAIVIASLLLAVQGYISLVLHPQAGAARGDPGARALFDTLHRRSVVLNTAVLIGLLGLTATGATLLSRSRDGRNPSDYI